MSEPPRDAVVRASLLSKRYSIFVIMPFRGTPTRTREDLTAFFEQNIKHSIESSEELPARCIVRRSDDTFDITEEIIRDLYAADIVICDLSGHDANPNVMYELGVRLSVSTKPVILIREANAANRPLFDIGTFYAFDYNPYKYEPLEAHLLSKIGKFQSGTETYTSPVLKILEMAPQVVHQLALRRAHTRLRALSTGFSALSTGALSDIFNFARELEMDLLPDRDEFELQEELCLPTIRVRQEELASLDWGQFRFRPTPPPAFVGYLQEPITEEVLPRASADVFVKLLQQFYKKYFVMEFLWVRPSLERMMDFIYHTIVLRKATDALLDALVAEDDADRVETALTAFALYSDVTAATAKAKSEFASGLELS